MMRFIRTRFGSFGHLFDSSIRLCMAPLHFNTQPKRYNILSVVLMLKLYSHPLEQADVIPCRCVGIECWLADNAWM